MSFRLALELRILAGDRADPVHGATDRCVSADGPAAGALVLIVSADDDMRSYLHEHLRQREGLRVLDAVSVAQAMQHIAVESPRVIVVDAPSVSLLTLRPSTTSVVLADALPDRPHSDTGHTEWVLMPWPFDVQALVSEVVRLAA